MLHAALWVVLALSPAEVKLAAPGLSTSGGLDEKLAAPLTDHLAQNFDGVSVVTQRDISAMLGLERQKQLLGCSEAASSCMAELGAALGVHGIVLGDVVKIGKTVQVNLRILDPVSGKKLATASERLDSEDLLFEALARSAKSLRAQLFVALGVVGAEPTATTSAPTSVRQPVTGARRFFPIPIVVGGVSLVAGTVFLVLSNLNHAKLTQGMAGSVPGAEALALAASGKTLQTLGAVALGLGATALLATVGLLVFGGDPSASQAWVGLTAGGLAFGGGTP